MAKEGNQSLGFIETAFVSVTSLVADAAAKAADVRIVGIEPAGTEQILIRLAANSVADLEAAVSAGSKESERLGVAPRAWTVLGNPSDKILALNKQPLTINALYGGREEMQPTDHPQTYLKKMKAKQEAIGILETQGLTASLEATDAMLKAADVRLLGKEKIGAAYVAIMIAGDVAAVTAAIEAGTQAVGDLGKLIAGHVIARPHDDILPLLPKISA